MSLIIPKVSTSLPPRPEFPAFTAPYLCASMPRPYDGKDFDTYPHRHGWTVHHQDKQCHVLCPPDICLNNFAPDDYLRRRDHHGAHRSVAPMLSREDGFPITAASKAAFLQSWLFFGTIYEVSRMCDLSINAQAEFLVDEGRNVSTTALNGLSGRWFASLDSARVGDKVFMKRILTITRKIALLMGEEIQDREGRKPVFQYTPDEGRALTAIDILRRELVLHLMLHIASPTFICTESDGWRSGHIWLSVKNEFGREGTRDLVDAAADLEARGWCKSETDFLERRDPELSPLSSTLDRPRAMDHSNCDVHECRAYQVVEEIYKTAHTDGCDLGLQSSCSFVRVSADDLVEILAQDQVPVVVITEDLQVQVVSGEDHPYIAFSHVCEYLEFQLPTLQQRGLTSSTLRGRRPRKPHRQRVAKMSTPSSPRLRCSPPSCSRG